MAGKDLTEYKLQDISDNMDPDKDGKPGITIKVKREYKELPFRKITVHESNVLDMIVDQAPYHILKHGPKALKIIADKLSGVLKAAFIGMAWGLEQLAKRFRIQ